MLDYREQAMTGCRDDRVSSLQAEALLPQNLFSYRSPEAKNVVKKGLELVQHAR